jgi:2',3'-cyclic-nucleotide 2'-phosphodiesterase (5'-nucleotidase family)
VSGLRESERTFLTLSNLPFADNFASLKTLLETMGASQQSNDKSNRVVSMLTGDFLSPYLLSSVDRGAGMMKAIAATPIDVLSWGNHEADIPHKTTCKHVANFKGVWINSNMQGHDAMRYQVPFYIVDVESPDGCQRRKIGMVAVLSDDPKLYAHFISGAFGGAKIENPWETLRKYEKILKEEHECDLVLPLEHLYMHENEKTCREFDFPVILSGHDHHRVDEIIEGTRLIKPGMDGNYATVLEIVWDSSTASKPTIRSTFAKVDEFVPCPHLKKQTDAAYEVLRPLRNTELARVLPQFEPLSSTNARSEVCTMGRFVCSILKASLEQTREANESKVDCVVLMGGNFRGGENYPIGSFFSLEMLEAEIKSDEVIGVVPTPGSVLAAGIVSTHAGDPRPGWMQYDDGIEEVDGRVVTVAGEPLNMDRIYRVATKISDLTNGQSQPLQDYFVDRKDLYPAKGDYINVQTELMGFFSRNLFRKLWDATGELMETDTDASNGSDGSTNEVGSEIEMESRLRLSVLDRDGDGLVTVQDIHYGLRQFLGLSVHEEETSLAECIYGYADVTGNGDVTVEDFEFFCTGLPRELRPLPSKWGKVFPKPVSMVDLSTVTEGIPSEVPEGRPRGVSDVSDFVTD